ncbi:hypothetical protein [Streptomyces carpinensis]|uniref:Glycine-rich domain-containing protein n=1 Tax=Streptomyces carpinensis TaxID=66369 RepID=A0ABV1W423_9ACTN|nr:hypothetical protein [Streptomyces carpinensis]
MASVCVDSDYFQVGGDGRLTLVPGSMGLRKIVYFRPAGTYSFRKADYPWLSRVFVQVQAAGGGSAGARSLTGQLAASAGGAGGGYSESLVEASALGATESVVVGAGGVPGGPTTDGGNGGNSSFGGFATANGGAGSPISMTSGTTVASFSGVAGPLAGTGDYVQGGGAGGGCLRLSGNEGQSGQGGESRLGHGGYQRASTGGGGNPRGNGAGGGGSLARDGDSTNGTPGGDGVVIAWLFA